MLAQSVFDDALTQRQQCSKRCHILLISAHEQAWVQLQLLDISPTCCWPASGCDSRATYMCVLIAYDTGVTPDVAVERLQVAARK